LSATTTAAIVSPEHLQNTSATWHDIGNKQRRSGVLHGTRWELRNACTQSRQERRQHPKLLPGRWNTNQDKGIILGYCEKHNLKRAGARELRAIEAELHRRSNSHRKSCLSYIAGVLREAGTRVEYTEINNARIRSLTADHHELRAKGLLKLRDLDDALTSLQKIDALYRQYREVSDRIGTSLARELVSRAEGRAKSMAANRRLSKEKRREKQEIARWFKVWLEVPDLFFDWLEMRQGSQDFQKRFPHLNGRFRHSAGKRSFSV
jgi:hypothetical protein